MSDFESDPARRRRLEDPAGPASPSGEDGTKRIRELREAFMHSDERLAVLLDGLGRGSATREECLLALIEQQRSYDSYMRAVLDRTGHLR